MQAHSGTDKIETLLLNLFRGTGNTSPFHSTNFLLNVSQTQKRKIKYVCCHATLSGSAVLSKAMTKSSMPMATTASSVNLPSTMRCLQ